MNATEAKKGFRTFLILAAVSAGAFGIYRIVPGQVTSMSSARAPEKPSNVQVKNITSNTATFTWETTVEARGYVVYGTSAGELARVAPEAKPSRKHQVIIENLNPGTTYYYKIGSGETIFGETPAQFTTLKK